MKKVLSYACIIAVIFISACGENGSDYNTTNSTVKPFTYPVTIDSNKSIFANTKKATGTKTYPQMFPSLPVQSGNVKSIAGLNPAHGQPMHRCDIAVGAPLNSPGQQVQQTAQATQSLPVLPQPSSNATVTAHLNPAHGQPGHRCDIAVGSPLTSPVNPQQTAPATQMFPALPKTESNASGTARLNPAHGQPGHDCTIAVGQPLKS